MGIGYEKLNTWDLITRVKMLAEKWQVLAEHLIALCECGYKTCTVKYEGVDAIIDTCIVLDSIMGQLKEISSEIVMAIGQGPLIIIGSKQWNLEMLSIGYDRFIDGKPWEEQC